MPSRPPSAAPTIDAGGLRLAAFEIVWIFLIFFIFAATPPPDVGESHYLVKAKHYWQPDWCAGDLFVESRDAHAAFNWVFGWVTLFVTLPAAAWIGRVVTWALLAWSWRRLSWAVAPRPLVALLSAGLLLLLLRNFHLAGEWIVGGVEAKGFAYVLVFLALEAIVRDRWRSALLLAGAAGAFHVLVGAWTAVAIGLAWLAVGRERSAIGRLLPAAAGGLVLALPGLVPAIALNWGVPEEVSREAARVYVFERLSHHLVYHRFPEHHIQRFGVLLVAWLALAIVTWKTPHVRRLQLVAAGTLALALVGVAIDQGFVLRANRSGWSAREYELAVAPLLRYYWFRASDALVPAATALAICFGLVRLQPLRPKLATWLTLAAAGMALANLADVYYWRTTRPVPGAILQPRPTADAGPLWWFSRLPQRGQLAPRVEEPQVGHAALPLAERADHKSPTIEQWYADWRAVCAWVQENTPADAKFITPREQQTFKWYAGRAELATWKDVPQDARALVQWRALFRQVYPLRWRHRVFDLAAFRDEELIRLADKHGASYIIIDHTRSRRPISLERVYPAFREENPSFAVYRVGGE